MQMTRRELLSAGVVGAAAALAQSPIAAFALGEPATGVEVIPFLDPQPGDPKRPMLDWERLTDWVTPESQLFAVNHYGTASVAADTWKLQVEGLVDKPVSLTLDELKARPKREATVTLECSGNGAGPGFIGAIGNVRWAGTPLAPLLKECAPKKQAAHVAFWADDKGKEKIHGDIEFEANFARGLSIANSMREDILLAWEMNGKPLPVAHGFPVRLIVPGWYGISWVKWLRRIELLDRPLMNRFMGRDYVTLRGQERNGKIVYEETSVGPMNLKSIVARVTRDKEGEVKVSGAAWSDGTPIKAVEVKIDNGKWAAAQLDQQHTDPYCWRFWSFDWEDPTPGEHTVVSRAIDEKGRVQPSADDPQIRLKKTYWEANAQYPRRIKL